MIYIDLASQSYNVYINRVSHKKLRLRVLLPFNHQSLVPHIWDISL